MLINNIRHRPLQIPFDFVIFTLNANIAGDLEYCLFFISFHLFLLPSRKASSNTHYDRAVTPCWDPVRFYMMLFLRAYCSLRNEMERNGMGRNEMEICSLRNENL